MTIINTCQVSINKEQKGLDLNDIILRGFCAACGHPVNRYLETGEVESYLLRIKKVRQKYK